MCAMSYIMASGPSHLRKVFDLTMISVFNAATNAHCHLNVHQPFGLATRPAMVMLYCQR